MTSEPYTPAKVLLVDDVRETRLAIEIMLQPLGLTVVAVDSGIEALRRMLVEDFAVILLDVDMPKMDGFETAELIRQRPRSEHTPIIFLSAVADDAHVTRGYALGAVDYIVTPVVPKVLTAKVSAFAELFHLNQQVRRQAAEQLALVEERTARVAAEKASLAKNEFVANISHELRTPMNAILGMSDLALNEDLSPLVREYLRIVKTNAHSLLELLNEILDYSRLEAGKFVIEATPFSLADLVLGVQQTMGWRAAEKELDFAVNVAADIPATVIGDPLRVRQILINLLGNAIKFTDQGQVNLNVTMQAAHAGEAKVRFDVVDTGIGISAEDQRRIFAPFAQADSSMTRRYGGTGLGLTIASDLIRAMGGTLSLQSELGAGSTFSFEVTLPVQPVSESAGKPAGAEPTQVVTDDPQSAPHPRKLLLAEDVRTNQMIVVRGLTKRGHTVEVASDGQEAVTAAEQSDYDLILMDLQMPVMDGFEATAAIREHEQDVGTYTPIIAVTALAMSGDRERCISAGMDGVPCK